MHPLPSRFGGLIFTSSYLSRPKEGSPVFITSDYLVNRYQDVKHQLTALTPSIANHSYLLYTLFTSLTKETPPFHISIRGSDDLAKKMTELSRTIGDAEYGTTFVSGGKSPEIAEFYNSNGILLKRIVDDMLFYQVGVDYVKKHERMILVGMLK